MKRLVLQLEGRGGTLSRIGPGESLGIGRAFDNDVVLADPYVSAYEARLEAGPEEWLLRLLDATNPVLVNDVPATGEVVRLADGDRLTFGRTRVRVFDEQRPPPRRVEVAVRVRRAPGRSVAERVQRVVRFAADVDVAEDRVAIVVIIVLLLWVRQGCCN